MKQLKTKSQMIVRIADLSEENTLLREQLYNKSETEQALQSALEKIAELKRSNDKYAQRIATHEKVLPQILYDKNYERDMANKYKSALEEIWDDIKAYEDVHGFLDCTFEVIEKEINEVLL